MLERFSPPEWQQSLSIRESAPIPEMPGFRGIPFSASEKKQFLLAPAGRTWSKSGLHVLQNTAHIGNHIGHMAVYDSLVPASANLREIPSLKSWLTAKVELVTLLKSFDAIMFRGGRHVGPHFLSRIKEDPSATQFHGYDAVADELDARLLRYALDEDQLFIHGICRGFEQVIASITELPPQSVVGHAPLSPSQEMLIHPVENVFAKLYGFASPVKLPIISQVNSFHQQGYTLEYLRPQLPRLAHSGWFVTHVHPKDQTVEMLIRLNSTDTQITGLATQFHPERLQTMEGEMFRQFSRKIVSAKT